MTGGSRSDVLRTRALAAGGLALLLVGTGIALSSALGGGGSGAARPATTETTTTTTARPAARPVLVRIPLAAVGAFDPEGDGQENDAQAPLAVDGDPATAWTTERYQSFFKQGVGLVLDAGAVRRLEQVDVSSGTPGVTALIRVGDAAGGPFTDASAPKELTARTRFLLKGARGRYVVVWITGMPDGSAAAVAEVVLRVRR